MDLDPNLPVVVGVGELTHRGPDPAPAPIELMIQACGLAIEDADVPSEVVTPKIGAIGANPSAGWADANPGGLVADALGATAAASVRASMQGGNGPQLVLNHLAQRIQDGEVDAALLCGAESLATQAAAMKSGAAPEWPEPRTDAEPTEVLEEDRSASNDDEQAVAMIAPIMAYPLIENALRRASGRTVAEHQELIAKLWSRFSEVAATRESAWSREALTPEQVGHPSPGNRRVTFPYTKLLNANIQVDQAAAVLLCSAGTAEALGIARERWVFVHAGAAATDEWFLSQRPRLDRSPAIAACASAALERAGIEASELGPIDLYSCFPAAVELAAGEIGLPLDDPTRPLTCTGGLTFFGGPGNNYATHGIAAVARELRAAPAGTHGLASALGWYATKHAIGIYGNSPPERPYRALTPEPEAVEAVALAEPAGDEAEAETCTVIFERDGTPSYGIVFARLADGRRVLGQARDAETLAALETDEFLGSRVRVAADRGTILA